MTTEYTFHEKGKEHPERPRKRAPFHKRVSYKLSKSQGPFMLRRDDGPWGPDRNTAEVMDQVRNWTKAGKVGAKLDIQDQTAMVFNLRTVEVEPPVPIPAIAPELRAYYERVFTRYGWATNLGNWYCRYVAGTSTVSRHGYYGDGWKGAAQDVGADTGDQLVLLADAAVHWTTDPTDSEMYNKLQTVIVHDRIWEKGVGWKRYYGEYHYHVHADVDQGVPCHP